MKNWTLALALGGAVATTVIGTANAASAMVSGPGGSGILIQRETVPFPQENVIRVFESFTAVGSGNYLDKVVMNASPGQIYRFDVLANNNSGQTWTDFHFDLTNDSQGGTSVGFLPPGINSAFQNASTATSTTINWENGTVANNSDVSFSFLVQTGVNFSGDTFKVREYASVPEPLTILGSLATIGFGAYAERKRKPSKSSKKDNTKGS
jgi:hypothetical protein